MQKSLSDGLTPDSLRGPIPPIQTPPRPSKRRNAGNKQGPSSVYMCVRDNPELSRMIHRILGRET